MTCVKLAATHVEICDEASDPPRSEQDREAGSDAQLPLQVEREHLPDGRSITYYSRPAGGGHTP